MFPRKRDSKSHTPRWLRFEDIGSGSGAGSRCRAPLVRMMAILDGCFVGAAMQAVSEAMIVSTAGLKHS